MLQLVDIPRELILAVADALQFEYGHQCICADEPGLPLIADAVSLPPKQTGLRIRRILRAEVGGENVEDVDGAAVSGRGDEHTRGLPH